MSDSAGVRMVATAKLRVGLVVASVVLCQFRPAVATDALAPQMPPLQYEVLDAKTGHVLSTVWGWTETVDAESVAVVSDTVFTQGNEWLVRTLFTRDLPPRCLSWESTLKDKSGNVLATNRTRWVPEVFPMLTEPFPADTYPIEAPMGYIVTRLDLGRQPTASFHTVFAGSVAQIDLWVDGREKVQVTAGQFDCYRVRMRANPQSLFPKLPAFLKPVLSFFIPTYTVWLTVDKPQTLVQFRGQMGPPGSPELLVRLLKVAETGR